MNPQILIIEDDLSIGLLLRVGGRRQGWQVHLAGTATEGLELLAANPINLVLLDMGLPDMSGAEALERIREKRPDVPVLIISGMPTDLEQLKPLGATGVLNKPFNLDDFGAVVRSTLQLEPAQPPAPTG